jgi:hypothetical protein
MPGVFPDYPAAVIRNTDTRREMVRHAPTAVHRRLPGHEHSQYIIAALAHVAKAGEPMLGPGQQLR